MQQEFVGEGMLLVKLTASIVQKLNHKYSLKVNELRPEVQQLFSKYNWPDNVRELENVLEYAFNFLEPGEKVISLEHLPGDFVKHIPNSQCSSELRLETVTSSNSNRREISLEQAVSQAEIKTILSQGNKQEAAQILEILVSGLYQKLKKYNFTGH